MRLYDPQRNLQHGGRDPDATAAAAHARVILGRPGLALVGLSGVEQRYRAVRAVMTGATVTEVGRGWV